MENNIIHIYTFRQTEKLADEIFQRFLLQMPELFKEQILAYKHWESAQASLLGKILLKFGFQELNLKCTLHDMELGEKDRPFINGEIDFNISHSGEYVIVSIAKNARVGVDVEGHRKIDINLFRKYFDENEWNEIQSNNNTHSVFFDLWTIKESAIKCDGRGVSVLSETHKQYAPDMLNTVVCDAVVFHYQQVVMEENYSCCVCSNEEFKTKLTKLQLSDLAGI